MKKLLSVVLCLVSISLFAQKQITIDPAVRLMSKDTQPSYLIEIPQTVLKDVEKDWLKYISSGSKGKASLVNGENLQTGVVNPNISANPFSVYSKLLETTEGVRITTWFTENDTVFLSKTLSIDKDLAIQKYLHDFGVSEYQAVVKAELRTEQDKQKGFEKELDGLFKEEEKATKKISESNRAIQKSSDNISKNNNQVLELSYKINAQRGMVERTIGDANANKGAKQTLKDLQNDSKKVEKNTETENKNIDNMKKVIREQERNIVQLKEKQKTSSAQVDAQKAKVKEVQTKLDGIQ